MNVLGIESSCDETAAAVVSDDLWVRSNVISSQVPIHRKFGGVVPELASRAHLEAILPVCRLALEQAGVGLAEIDAVAVTRGPGLIGALMVGVQTAKAIAYATGRPLVGVDHIEAHITAIRLRDERQPSPCDLPHPHVALAVSGGHTALYRVDGPGELTLLGQTLDDAAGEAFDKVAKMLGLGYPGGKVIDDLARDGDPAAISFPRAWLGTRHNMFSFSGLKTAVRNHVRKHGVPTGQGLADLAASFQESVVHVLVKKSLRATKAEGAADLVVAGGVAANSRLRERFESDARKAGVRVLPTALRYCSDNAAMIAGLGVRQLARSGPSDCLELDADARPVRG